MKSYEAFSASVYEKTEARKKKIRARNRMISQTALCAVMVVAVAALSGVYSREQIKPEIELYSMPLQIAESVPHKLGKKDRPQMLVVMNEGGESKASILKTPEDQQVFVRQLSPENDDSKASLQQEAFEGTTIHSLEELASYLELLPAPAGPLPDMEDYDELFFAENDLYIMPLDLKDEPITEEPAEAAEAPPEEETTAAEEGTTAEDTPEEAATEAETTAEATTAAPLPTIPDDVLGEDVDLDSTEPNAVAGAAAELTTIPPFPSSYAGDANEGSAARIVRVFILIPMSKTEVGDAVTE